MNSITTIILLVFSLIFSTNLAAQNNIDSPKNNNYPTIVIDGLSWMTENLNYEVDGSWCYEDEPLNCEKYGRFYSWEAAVNACAALGNAWRLPTYDELNTLIKNIGENEDAYKALIQGGSTGFNAYPQFRYWSSTARGPRAACYIDFKFNMVATGFMIRNYGLSNRSEGILCRCVKEEGVQNK